MDKDKMDVSYILYESAMARNERTVKRLIIALMVCVALLFASNGAWLYAWSQYDYSNEESTETVTVDAKEGTANYIGNDGDIVNGEDSGTQND